MNPEKVFGYIDSLQQNKDNEIQDSNFKNSMEYKHKCLDKAKDYWYWSESQLTRLCEFLCNDEDYQVLTTKDWWLRHEV